SGADAITDGIRMLRLGETDAMLVGGAEAEIVRMPLAAFKNMEALSESGISRPFDARRDGFVMGEGAGVLVLERAEAAARRGARANDVPVSSLKSSIGHLIGAAGAVEAVATLLALRARVAPPTLNWEVAEEGLDLDYVPNQSRPLLADGNGREEAVGLSNAF